MTGVDSNGNNTYADASAYNLMNYDPSDVNSKPRRIEDSAGRLLVTDETVTAFNNSLVAIANNINSGMWGSEHATKTAAQYKAMTLDQIEQDSTFTEFFGEMYAAANNNSRPTNWDDYLALVQKLGTTTMAYYQNLFIQMISGNYTAPGDNNLKNPAWLDGQVNAGNLFL